MRKAALFNDTRIDLHYGCDRVIANIFALAKNSGIEIVLTVPAHTDWESDPEYQARLASVDLIIVNGEGSIHNDRLPGRWLLRVGQFAKDRGVPAALINASWNNNSAEFVTLAKAFRLIAVRDSASQKELREAGVSARVVPDMTFYRDGLDLYGKQRCGYGFTDGVSWETTEFLDVARRQAGGEYIPIQYAGQSASAIYEYFRYFVGKADVSQPVRLLQKLIFRVKSFFAQKAIAGAYLDKVSGLQLVVSGRFHAATISILAGTPVLLLLPPHKTKATDGNKLRMLVQDIGLEEWRLTSTESYQDCLLKKACTWTDGETERIRNFIKRANLEINSLFHDISALN